MSFRTFSPSHPADTHVVHDGWRSWLIGAGLGAAAQLFFVGEYITWFLGALCHEMGHTAAAVLTGSPSFPAIRLDGHAATQIHDRYLWIALGVLALGAVWCARAHGDRMRMTLRAACLVPLAVAALWPSAREVMILYAGHLGELLFAGIFLWRAYTGGFTQHSAERPLYAALGWMFVWENLVLAIGLMVSASARTHYSGNGSFGGENDLVRVAFEHFGSGLPVAAIPLLAAAVATPVAAWWLGALFRDAAGPGNRQS